MMMRSMSTNLMWESMDFKVNEDAMYDRGVVGGKDDQEQYGSQEDQRGNDTTVKSIVWWLGNMIKYV